MKRYKVEYTERAIKELRKLDKYTRQMLYSWIDKNLVNCENPKLHGKLLTANRKGQWRYRVGDYRIIAEIQDDRIVILILTVGHRSEVYS
ncbi:MAG: type II toxin-antitoxin system RelE/ParE family toxin [Faecousia sp.]